MPTYESEGQSKLFPQPWNLQNCYYEWITTQTPGWASHLTTQRGSRVVLVTAKRGVERTEVILQWLLFVRPGRGHSRNWASANPIVSVLSTFPAWGSLLLSFHHAVCELLQVEKVQASGYFGAECLVYIQWDRKCHKIQRKEDNLDPQHKKRIRSDLPFSDIMPTLRL